MGENTNASFLKGLEVARDASTVVVSLSLLLGVSFLSGTCAAIGPHTFGYLTATDIARSALRVSPYLVFVVALALFFRILIPSINIFSPIERSDGVRGHLRFVRVQFVVFLLLSVPAYLFYTETAFYSFLISFMVSIFFALWDYFEGLLTEGVIDPMARAAANVALLCVSIASFGYFGTASTIAANRAQATEIVCVSGGCRDAKIIARFSDATVVQWDKEQDVSLLMNGDVVSVKLKREPASPPLLKIESIIGWFGF